MFAKYFQGYKPTNSTSDYQSIPLEKIEDFGVHADAYYPIEISIFKSKLDDELLGLLWNKYWVNTLSQTPLISVRIHFLERRLSLPSWRHYACQNRAYAASQLSDLAAKLSKASPAASRGALSSTVTSVLAGLDTNGTALKSDTKIKVTPKKSEKKDELEQVVKDRCVLA